MISYFDTSAFVKLVLEEPGTDEARQLFFAASHAVSSRLLEPEARAAVARAGRSGRLSRKADAEARTLTREILDQVTSIGLDSDLAGRAGELAETLGLRGYDAVHLASFEVLTSDALLVAADGELVRAARSLGYAVAVPAG